jgi:2-polyprenyl-6-methoxyphenol hydroxylase-like FAD-dependent oxidoreductase
MNSRTSPAHALVVGAGMAGLAAAQALSRHVERVTLIERDDLPDRPTSRAGVPQGRHAPALQPGGLAALERLVPGFGADLVAAGAVPIGLPADLLWLTPAGWMTRFPSCDRHVFMSASRELIEWTFRRRVLEAPQVVVRSGLEVRGLEVDRGRVRGVAVRSRRAGAEGPEVTIEADLVVDASGRRSPAPAWLAAHGVAPPDETTVDTRIAYASRVYRRTAGDTPGWKGALIQAAPPGAPRAGVLQPLEGSRWLLTLTSSGDDEPPTDEVGFLAFAHTLRSLDVARVVARAEPLGPIAGYTRTSSRRRWFEREPRSLDGFLAVGDALCAVNPVHAQGMSVAALAAEALDRRLAEHLAGRRDLAGFSAPTQRAVARAGDGAWRLAAAAEGGHRGRGRRRAPGAVRAAARARYFRAVAEAALVDARVNAAQIDVIGLLAPPRSLLRPGVAVRAWRHRDARPVIPPVWTRQESPSAAVP